MKDTSLKKIYRQQISTRKVVDIITHQEMQVKDKISYHSKHISEWIKFIKTSVNTKCQRCSREANSFLPCWQDLKVVQSLWKPVCQFILKLKVWGSWVAQLFKCLTLDFGSGHDLTVCEIEPQTGICADSEELTWDSLSPYLCPSLTHGMHMHALSLSLSQNKSVLGIMHYWVFTLE